MQRDRGPLKMIWFGPLCWRWKDGLCRFGKTCSCPSLTSWSSSNCSSWLLCIKSEDEKMGCADFGKKLHLLFLATLGYHHYSQDLLVYPKGSLSSSWSSCNCSSWPFCKSPQPTMPDHQPCVSTTYRVRLDLMTIIIMAMEIITAFLLSTTLFQFDYCPKIDLSQLKMVLFIRVSLIDFLVVKSQNCLYNIFKDDIAHGRW